VRLITPLPNAFRAEPASASPAQQTPERTPEFRPSRWSTPAGAPPGPAPPGPATTRAQQTPLGIRGVDVDKRRGEDLEKQEIAKRPRVDEGGSRDEGQKAMGSRPDDVSDSRRAETSSTDTRRPSSAARKPLRLRSRQPSVALPPCGHRTKWKVRQARAPPGQPSTSTLPGWE
jgi:hypothetical protein